MGTESTVNPEDTMKKTNKIVNSLYIGVIFLFLITIISVFSVFNSAPKDQNIVQEQTIPNSTITEQKPVETVIPMKSLELLADVVSGCNGFVSSNDAKSYCSTFRKVSFDGLEVFVNCDYSEVKLKLSSTLACTDNAMSAKEVCDKYQLNSDEFVSVNGRVNNCAESVLR